jgi:hypothetical protein
VEPSGVLIDDERGDEPDSSPPLKGVWAAIAGAVVIVVIAVISSASTGDPSPPASTLPELPTVTTPPAMAQGEVVDETLDWVKPVGLGDADQIGGVVEFRDLYWLFGAGDEGLAVWTSTDGVRWSAESPITVTGEWRVDTVHASEEGLAVAVTGWSGGEWKHFIYSSPDGSRWGFREVPLGDSQLNVLEFTSIHRVEDGYLVQGWVGPEPVAQYMPDPFAQLIRGGHARAEVWPDRVRVHLNPGLLVAEIPVADLPGFEPVAGVRQRAVWFGPDLDSLEPIDALTHPEMIPQRIVETVGGLYVGVSEGFLMTSADGLAWDLAPVNTSAFEIVEWAGGVAGAGRTAAPFWWRPGASEVQLLVPAALDAHPDHFRELVAGSGVGVGLMERERPQSRSRQQGRSVPIGDHVYRVETDDGVELIRDEDVVWSKRLPGSTVSIVDGDVVFVTDEAAFSIPIDRWVAMTAPLYIRSPTPGPRVIHSADGTRWSESTWEEIRGLTNAGEVELHGAGDFLMVVSISSDGDDVDTVAVGRAVD